MALGGLNAYRGRAVEAPFRFQLTRSGAFEMNWTAYSYILPRSLADNTT
jgi:hypothetical protein